MAIPNNPLRQFFRQPAIYIRLPSGGKFWPEGALNLPPNQELPIYPMTAIDEITSRTPDALFNGSSMVKIIESCVPDIKDAWHMPSIDIDALLVATRIATYGHTLEIDSQCPKCSTEAPYSLDLRFVLDSISVGDYSAPIQVGDLKIFFKPLDYKQLNDAQQNQFEDQKLIQVLENAEISESEKMQRLSEAFLKITKVTVGSLASGIAAIRTPDTTVTEFEFILDFLNNCEKTVFTAIRDHATSLRESTELKPLKIKCHECQHEYEQPFTLNLSNFFVNS